VIFGANILDLCKLHQDGRAPKKGANAPFDFTEGWFRTSGLYDLNPFYQMDCLRNFIFLSSYTGVIYLFFPILWGVERFS